MLHSVNSYHLFSLQILFYSWASWKFVANCAGQVTIAGPDPQIAFRPRANRSTLVQLWLVPNSHQMAHRLTLLFKTLLALAKSTKNKTWSNVASSYWFTQTVWILSHICASSGIRVPSQAEHDATRRWFSWYSDVILRCYQMLAQEGTISPMWFSVFSVWAARSPNYKKLPAKKRRFRLAVQSENIRKWLYLPWWPTVKLVWQLFYLVL